MAIRIAALCGLSFFAGVTFSDCRKSFDYDIAVKRGKLYCDRKTRTVVIDGWAFYGSNSNVSNRFMDKELRWLGYIPFAELY